MYTLQTEAGEVTGTISWEALQASEMGTTGNYDPPYKKKDALALVLEEEDRGGSCILIQAKAVMICPREVVREESGLLTSPPLSSPC